MESQENCIKKNLTRDHKDLYSRQNAIRSDAADHNEFPGPRKLKTLKDVSDDQVLNPCRIYFCNLLSSILGAGKAAN